jgi:hypothetical protein
MTLDKHGRRCMSGHLLGPLVRLVRVAALLPGSGSGLQAAEGCRWYYIGDGG